jgi:hypothetical protein
MDALLGLLYICLGREIPYTVDACRRADQKLAGQGHLPLSLSENTYCTKQVQYSMYYSIYSIMYCTEKTIRTARQTNNSSFSETTCVLNFFHLNTHVVQYQPACPPLLPAPPRRSPADVPVDARPRNASITYYIYRKNGTSKKSSLVQGC